MKVTEPSIWESRQPGRKLHMKPFVVRDLAGWLLIRLYEMENAVRRLEGPDGEARFEHSQNTLNYYRWARSVITCLVSQLRYPVDAINIHTMTIEAATAVEMLLGGKIGDTETGVKGLINGRGRIGGYVGLGEAVGETRQLLGELQGEEPQEGNQGTGGLVPEPSSQPDGRTKSSVARTRKRTVKGKAGGQENSGHGPSTDRAKHPIGDVPRATKRGKIPNQGQD